MIVFAIARPLWLCRRVEALRHDFRPGAPIRNFVNGLDAVLVTAKESAFHNCR